jgi:hypothetical protein
MLCPSFPIFPRQGLNLANVSRHNFEPGARLILAGTIQFAASIQTARQDLAADYPSLIVPQSKPLSPGLATPAVIGNPVHSVPFVQSVQTEPKAVCAVDALHVVFQVVGRQVYPVQAMYLVPSCLQCILRVWTLGFTATSDKVPCHKVLSGDRRYQHAWVAQWTVNIAMSPKWMIVL